jgi:hypothetical protein
MRGLRGWLRDLSDGSTARRSQDKMKGDRRREGGGVMAKTVLGATFVAVMVLTPARAALADGGEEDFAARDLVEQAIGLLQGQPEMEDLIGDRIADALEDDEVEGVDLALVAEAQEAFEEGRASETIELLARSIGEEVGPALHQPEVGGGLTAPEGTAGPVLITVAAVLILSGALVAAKVR